MGHLKQNRRRYFYRFINDVYLLQTLNKNFNLVQLFFFVYTIFKIIIKMTFHTFYHGCFTTSVRSVNMCSFFGYFFASFKKLRKRKKEVTQKKTTYRGFVFFFPLMSHQL